MGRLPIERRGRRAYAGCARDLIEVHYPQAVKIRLVQDNLSTHAGASVLEALRPEVARRLLAKIECPDTPKHCRRVNRAETERSINSHGLDRRLHSQALSARRVAAWESKRNDRQARILWTLTLAAARPKLRNLDLSIEG